MKYWSVIRECCPGFCLSDCYCFGHSCCSLEFSFWINVCEKLLVCAMYFFVVHYFYFLSGVSGSECIPVMQNLNAAILCSIEWFEKKLVVVSVLVGPRLRPRGYLDRHREHIKYIKQNDPQSA